MTFWAITYLCLAPATIGICMSPDPGYDPAASFYSTEAVCKLRLEMATLPPGLQGQCVETDTITFSSGRFMPNAGLFVTGKK